MRPTVEAGIDEAGRGPVLGPLVVGLVASPEPQRVHALGVRDSKQLTAKRREDLAPLIRETARVETLALSAQELDRRMARFNLNEVEVALFGELGRRVDALTYYVDACDVNEERFGDAFARELRRSPAPRVVSEHGADLRYPLVSAASIVAKVERDAAIREIGARLGPKVGLPVGSGYAHDETTIAFLRRHLDLFGRLPAEARTKWNTARRLTAERQQRQLPGP